MESKIQAWEIKEMAISNEYGEYPEPYQIDGFFKREWKKMSNNAKRIWAKELININVPQIERFSKQLVGRAVTDLVEDMDFLCR